MAGARPADQEKGKSIAEPAQQPSAPRLSKVCTLWVHDEGFAKEEVLFNASIFSPEVISSGQLMRVLHCKDNFVIRNSRRAVHPEKSAVEDGPAAEVNVSSTQKSEHKPSQATIGKIKTSKEMNDARVNTNDENERQENKGGFLFRAEEMSVAQKSKHANLQISISTKIAKSFRFRNRCTVLVTTTEEQSHAASHVEILFRDLYLTRGDMWRMSMSQLHNKPIYKGQRLEFLNTVRATINTIYFKGKKVKSAVFSANTRPIFRSQSARFVIYIQMSKEMWEFDTEASGDLMFEKAVAGFLPKLFRIWDASNTSHLVSVVMFTRMRYENVPQHSPFDDPPPHDPDAIPTTKDFYRVVVSDMASGKWTTILEEMRREFQIFQREISIEQRQVVRKGATPDKDVVMESFHWGHPTTANQGNILEAISLATARFSKDYIDRDLARTGISVIIITPGTGIFEVEENMLKLTTENLIDNGIGIDLVSLSPMPLHSTPIFKYMASSTIELPETTPKEPLTVEEQRLTPFKDPFTYAMPHWLDVSFWKGNEPLYLAKAHPADRVAKAQHKIQSSFKQKEFTPRIRMYDAQMEGFMENEMTGFEIPFISETNPRLSKYEEYSDEWWDAYDEQVWAPVRADPAGGKDAGSSKVKFAAPSKGKDTTTSKKKDPHASKTPNLPTESKGTESKQGVSVKAGKARDVPNIQPSDAGKGDSESLRETFFDKTMKGRASELDGEQPKSERATMTPRAGATLGRVKPDRKAILSYLSSALKDTEYARTSGGVLLDIKIAKGSSSQKEQLEKSKPITIASKETRTVSEQFKDSLSRARRLQDQAGTPSDPISIQNTPKVTEQDFVEPSHPNVIQAASFSKSMGPRFDLLAKTAPQSPKTSAKTSANRTDELSWLVIANPCNPTESDMNAAQKFGRWQHVFAVKHITSKVKWRSLTCPAALPITTESLPSFEVLQSQYEEFPYKITPSDELNSIKHLQIKGYLMRELIGFRLSHGYQIVVNTENSLQEAMDKSAPAVSNDLESKFAIEKMTDTSKLKSGNIFAKDFAADDGIVVTMTKGSIIHELHGLENGEIQIIRRHRKSNPGESKIERMTIPYETRIKTLLADSYEVHELKFTQPQEEYNWSHIDNYLAGHTEVLSVSLKHWQARFVLIPVEPRRRQPTATNDTDEEIRIEGIQKLTQIWQRNRIGVAGEYRMQTFTERRRDQNPLAIEYQTRDPSKAIAAGLSNSNLVFADANESNILDSIAPKQFLKAQVDLRSLATELQGVRGIKIQDRRWHFKLHHDCFDGTDLTSWLVENFKDLENRDEAVNYGNELMEKGFFDHVQKKHQFRDGNFFYSLSEEYRQPRPESRAGWFGSRKTAGSVPSTPLLEAVKSPATTRAVDAMKSPELAALSSPAQGSKLGKPKVALSAVLKYDVDHRRRSYRPEIINLHYDRLHNPENCYHIRIDWMNVTSKFIEDAVVSWATTSEYHGLKLVELPIAEACAINETHPFRTPYLISLRVPPPTASTSVAEPQAGANQDDSEAADTASATKSSQVVGGQMERHVYQQAILKKFDFVLDIEAASNFPDDYDVTYSWGKPDYRFTQYIHRTGVLLAEIMDDGVFLLVANRMSTSRGGPVALTAAYKDEDMERRMTGPGKGKATAVHSQPATQAKGQRTAEQLKDELEEFCNNKNKLEAFYDEISKKLSTPQLPTPVAGAEEKIPELALPDKVAV